MITENIVLRSDYKKDLKHLSIDMDIYVSEMLVNSAKYILSNDLEVHQTSKDFQYENFTMKIEEDLKSKIKQFCKNQDVKIKDFWNEAARRYLECCKISLNS